ncbi:hypothetical protein [Streptomyces sp. NPDC052107]|uniref:hypothetical protein n=1 Tax=Streptomyces sp. NPDC052107 TaxID=3155632 RepID=UPI0034207854
MTNAFALLRLLPMNDRVKDVEIVVLSHQIVVLERQLIEIGRPFARAASGLSAGRRSRTRAMEYAATGSYR